MNVAELGTAAVNWNMAANQADNATVFGLGGPKDIKMFYRWNVPQLTYSFDASFVSYFGYEGIDAVNDAFRVVNDFFVPEDGAYSGVSQLDLAQHGFAGNYNTAWVNTTAENAQIIDLKSLVLGMLVNQLGLGNPHRYAFSIAGAAANAAGTQMNFRVRLRNYDPLTWKATDKINGVTYAYRLIHNATMPNPLNTVGVADMEEFTADTSGNAWASVAAIPDSFYGDTRLYWNDQPTLFGFGVYYDRMNSMGGQYKPRHALTYDDAGGLKYLYRTNNYKYERLHADVQQITPPQMLPMTAAEMQAVNANWSGIPIGLHFPQPSGGRFPSWPRAGGDRDFFVPRTNPANWMFALGLSNPGTFPPPRGMFLNSQNPPAGAAFAIGPQATMIRGGIDKIQFYHQPFDSLMAQVFIPTNFVWEETIVVRQGFETFNLNNTNQGASIFQGHGRWVYAKETLARSQGVAPDFLFTVRDLGVSADGVPIAFSRGNTTTDVNGAHHGDWTAFVFDDDRNQIPVAFLPDDAAKGPGVIWHRVAQGQNPVGSSSEFAFTKLNQDFEMIWSGEMSLVGNQDKYGGLWGWIKGPGPNDVVVFPDEQMIWKIDNEIIPSTSAPTVSMVSDDGGVNPIESQTYTRTEETLTIIGNGLVSATAIDIVSGGIVLQSISPVEKYVVSNQQIDIPAGVFNESIEGPDRQLRVWNTVGSSQLSPQKFNINTGRPVLTGTSADKFVYNREQTLTLHGYGFKSKTPGETKLGYVRVDKSDGSAIFDKGIVNGGPSDGIPLAAIFEVVDDTYAVLSMDSVNYRADGSNRRLRVARRNNVAANDLGLVLSPPVNELISVVTAKPVANTLTQLEENGVTWTSVTSNGAFRRDRVLEINGTALNTTSTIEVIREDGTSFPNPVYISLPNSAVTVDDNGTRILIAGNAIPYSDADTNGSIRRSLRLYNAADNTDLNSSLMFAVNIQPEVTGLSGFAVPGAFNRSKLYGDDVEIYGKGFLAVSEVRIVDLNGSDVVTGSPARITLPHPSVTVADGRIVIDTSGVQFSSGSLADTDLNNTSRIFLLSSARDNATTSQASRFAVGIAPNGITVANIASAGNYQRDLDVMNVTGSGLGMVSKVEMVDGAGNLIPGGLSLTTTTGVNIIDHNLITINQNAAGWLPVVATLDSVATMSRRIKVTTPFGTTTSPPSAVGAFTVSAIPKYGVTAQNTYGGGGYNGGAGANGTYTLSSGDLTVAGLNFRGVSRIEFLLGDMTTAANGDFAVTANAPPAGIVFSADGTQLTFNTTIIPVAWAASELNASIRMTTPAGASNRTANIITAP